MQGAHLDGFGPRFHTDASVHKVPTEIPASRPIGVVLEFRATSSVSNAIAPSGARVTVFAVLGVGSGSAMGKNGSPPRLLHLVALARNQRRPQLVLSVLGPAFFPVDAWKRRLECRETSEGAARRRP